MTTESTDHEEYVAKFELIKERETLREQIHGRHTFQSPQERSTAVARYKELAKLLNALWIAENGSRVG
jgi:hypothetical protein